MSLLIFLLGVFALFVVLNALDAPAGSASKDDAPDSNGDEPLPIVDHSPGAISDLIDRDPIEALLRYGEPGTAEMLSEKGIDLRPLGYSGGDEGAG